jgi:wobble nucleotide-excising tRNase
VPIILNIFAFKNIDQKILNDAYAHNPYADILTDDGVKKVGDLIKIIEERISKHNQQASDLNKSLIFLFEIQWILFLIGLVSLMISRGYENFLVIINFLAVVIS